MTQSENISPLQCEQFTDRGLIQIGGDIYLSSNMVISISQYGSNDTKAQAFLTVHYILNYTDAGIIQTPWHIL